jgi:hypothetical protein
MKRAFNLADKSAFDYYKDLSEKGYYNRIISGNVQQRIEVDSVVCNFDNILMRCKPMPNNSSSVPAM